MDNPYPLRTILRNGEVALIREVGPDDRALMREGFLGLSDRSRMFRFLAPHKALSEAELDRFTQTNTEDHFAIGALSIGVAQAHPLAVARFFRSGSDPTQADFALTIIDSHQRLGLGTLMLRLLAGEAQRRGIKSFSATVHPQNIGIKALMKGFGGARLSQDITEDWHLPLPLHAKVLPPQDPNTLAICHCPS